MPTAADSSEEEDLPSLAELLARKRATKSSQGGVGQQEKVLSASATPSKVTAARTTARNDDSAQDGPHSTPPRRSPRRPSSTAIDGVQPTAGVLRHPLPSTAPKTVNQRSLAEELFPSSPPPPLVTRHNLYNYREPSPSVISDSEPDLPSPVRRRTGQQSASEEGSATEVRRKASRDSFYVEDSEDERVRTASGSASATNSAQEDERPLPKAPRGKGRGSLAVFDLDSDVDEQPFLTRKTAADFGDDDPLDDSPGFMTSFASPFLSSIVDTPRASKPKSATRITPLYARRRITISISDSGSSDSEADASVKARPTPRPTKKPSTSASDVEVLVVDDEDTEEGESRTREKEKRRDDEVVVSLPTEISMGGTPIRSRSETPEEQFDDMDPNDGVLVYEPTPRARKPMKLPSSLGNSPAASPSRTPGHVRKPMVASKRSVSIDLTGSSDSDSDTEPPKRPTTATRLFPPPRAAPKPRLNPTASPSSTSKRPSKPTPSTPARTPARKSTFPTLLTDAQRESLPIALIRELDRAVFRKSWEGIWCTDRDGESTGPGLPDGIEVKWNKKLRNTAGRASWKRMKTGGTTVHVCSIDLATKVTDTEEKLRHTLAHELCHIAAWVLSGEVKPPHGDAFKLWAKRIMSVRSNIVITTTHSYEIAYKFRWKCLNSSCGKIFSRHSRSIDPTAQGCPCGSMLTEIDANGQPKVVRRVPAKKSGWQEYLAANPGIRNEDVFKLVAERYRAAKSAAEVAEAAREGEGGLSSAMGRLGV